MRLVGKRQRFRSCGVQRNRNAVQLRHDPDVGWFQEKLQVDTTDHFLAIVARVTSRLLKL